MSAPTVLLCEDHDTLRGLIARQLVALGCDVVPCADGLEGFQAFLARRFALVVTDLGMPGLDGDALARRMREVERADAARARTPIIVLTGDSGPAGRNTCLAAGIDEVLVKPVLTEELRAAVQRWLAREPIDLDLLAACLGDDPPARQAVLADFLEVDEADRAELREAAGRADADAVARLAHRIEGAARMLGALEYATVAGAVRMRAREAAAALRPRDLDGVLDLLDRARDRLEAGLAALNSVP